VALGDPESTPTRFVLRTSGDRAIAASALAAIRGVDARVPAEAHPIDVLIGARLSPTLVIAKALLGLSAFTLLLAIINIYALAAFGVAQRRREIGLRMALGADRRQAMRLAMRRSLVWSLAGLAIGSAAAIWFVRPALASTVPDLGADLGLLALVLVSVGLTAVLAAWIPARRAAAIDPAITLRAE
jgi:ABC-type antimicrobial peptide transport system permease subunit